MICRLTVLFVALLALTLPHGQAGAQFTPAKMGGGIVAPAWTPAKLATPATGWWTAQSWSTLTTNSSTMRSAGTSPPVISVATSGGTQPFGLVIQCTLLGVRGVWQFRYSLDNGNTWTNGITSAATVAIANGLTLTIATGAAATNDVWTSTISAWANKGTVSDSLTNSVVAQSVYTLSAINGHPALYFDGVANSYSSGVNASSYISTTAGVIYAVVSVVSVTNDSASPNSNDGLFSTAAGYTGLSFRKSTVVASAFDFAPGFLFTSTTAGPAIVLSTPFVVKWAHFASGASMSITVNGGAATTVSSGTTGGLANTWQVMRDANAHLLNGYLGELIMTTSITTGDEAKLYAYFNAKWGTSA